MWQFPALQKLVCLGCHCSVIQIIFECLPWLRSQQNLLFVLNWRLEGAFKICVQRKISALHFFMGSEFLIFEERSQYWTAVMSPFANLPLPLWVLYLPLPLPVEEQRQHLRAWNPRSESRYWTRVLPCQCVSHSSAWGWRLDIHALLLWK